MSARYKRLWADVPDDERVTEEYLSGCVGASDPVWVSRQRDRLNNASSGCPVAVKWGGSGLWIPCPFGVKASDGFCHIHTSCATEYHRRREEARALKDTKREYERLSRKRSDLMDKLAGVQMRLHELEAKHACRADAHTLPTNASPLGTRSEQSEAPDDAI